MNFLNFIKTIDKTSYLIVRTQDKNFKHLIRSIKLNISKEIYKNFQNLSMTIILLYSKNFKGEICNVSENKPATHFQYRAEGNNLYESNLKNLKAVLVIKR